MLGAILVIGSDGQAIFDGPPAPPLREQGRRSLPQLSLLNGPIASAELLGHSTLERTIARLLAADVEIVTLLWDASASDSTVSHQHAFDKVKSHIVADVQTAVSRTLNGYSQNGIEHAFVARGDLYTECDLLDLFQFHRETRQSCTRTCDRNGTLDFWVVNCHKARYPAITFERVGRTEFGRSSYCIREYVNRLASPQDLRRLVVDAFRGHCELRPSGHEVRPGVWVEDGAQIHKRARIVAPAFVGRESRVREDALITRGSNIERSCYVDYGTVIEDSSILANSYIGIWLDVAHAVVRGNALLNVSRNVLLEISDSSVIRTNIAIQKEQGREPMAAVTPESLAYASSR